MVYGRGVPAIIDLPGKGKMNVYQELKDRGFVYQETDAATIEKLLTTGSVTFYVGFDPTGSSLHVGHLLPIMAMRLLQRYGHKPIALVGGATAQIGDPSGRITVRPILTKEEVAANAEALKCQLSRFINFHDGNAHFVNNADWLCQINYIDFLREIGSKFSVSKMIAQDSVKSRLGDGLTFLEFNYSILQAYDFVVLNERLGCQMQFGGQDQWGNMVAGTELARKMGREGVEALTFPLLLDGSGKKFGKTAGGHNIWLDVNRTSVFDYYQFWRNCEDSQLEKLLCYFTALPVDEIRRLAAPEQTAAALNRAKEILAYEATMLAHGEEEAAKAFLAAGGKFGFADPENRIATSSAVSRIDVATAAKAALPSVTLPAADFSGEGCWICKLMVTAGLCGSTGEARRLIQGGGAYCNERRIADVSWNVTADVFENGEILLKAGKKNMKRIIME